LLYCSASDADVAPASRHAENDNAVAGGVTAMTISMTRIIAEDFSATGFPYSPWHLK
jgi:hypothetical protein